MAGFVERVGEDGENDLALGAADEIEAALVLDELGLSRHLRGAGSRAMCWGRKRALGSIHRVGKRIKRKLDARNRKFDLYQIGTDAADGEIEPFEGEFAAYGVTPEAKSRD